MGWVLGEVEFKVLSGRSKECPSVIYVVAAIFAGKFIFL